MKPWKIALIIMGTLYAVIYVGAIATGIIGAFEDTETVTVEEPKKEKASPPKEKEKEKEKEPEFTPEEIFETMQNSYSGTAAIEYNEKHQTFLIIPYEESIAAHMVRMQRGNTSTTEWEGVVETTRTLSATIGSPYSVAIVNPVNEENIFLLVSDGVVLYNAVTDGNEEVTF